jgi:predicted glycoside hydrolase/deacetylase ChbG (UPF0249 family)
MTHKRDDESHQPSDSIRDQGGHTQPSHTCNGNPPVRDGGGTAYRDKKSNLLDQGPHHRSQQEKKIGNENVNWKHIVVCADDFGMNDGTDAGIIQLATLGRVSAISCLTHGPTFDQHSASLQNIQADIGVHLNLTECFGHPQQPDVLPLSSLILRAYSRQLDGDWIDEQINQQLDAFEQAVGRAPDYIDGHQHIHQLPQVLPRLMQQIKQRYRHQRPWLRYTAPGSLTGIPFGDSAKARVIGALGASSLVRAAYQNHYPTNRRLLGVYSLQGGAAHYRTLLHQWLTNAHHGDLLMCHPALTYANDALAAQRAAEFEVLSDPELGEWMQQHHLHITRPFWGMTCTK